MGIYAQSAGQNPYPLPCILIADADRDTRSLYRTALEPFATIEEAEDGAEALAIAIARRPALVVTETRLPRIDGCLLCSMLRDDAATRHTRIVVVTASALPADLERARRAGADVILSKPCDVDVIRDRATDLLLKIERTDPAELRLVAGDSQPSEQTSIGNGRRQRLMSRTHRRETTTTPPLPPPDLRCPMCDATLAYQYSHLGGVSARFPEQWDQFTCESCGAFQYRHRTRALRCLED
jgi:CheY-like chemotaxis protein